MSEPAPAVPNRTVRPPEDWLISAGDVASILDLSRSQLLREVHEGRLICARVIEKRSRTYRFFAESNIRDYLNDWCRPAYRQQVEPRLIAKLAA